MALAGTSVVALLSWFAAAAVATAASIEWLIRWAIRRDLLDHPNHRSSHDVPTPRLGGVGIACVLLGGLAWLALRSPEAGHGHALLTLVVLGLVVAALSLYDDVRSVAPPYRLAAHVVVAVSLVWTVGTVGTVAGGALGRVTLTAPWAGVLTALWVVSLINAFNFVDGIDGMAGAQAAVAALGWVVLGSATGNATLVTAGVLLLAAAAGFLWHNWSPARIFMGDGGSALLGFLLATVPWVIGGPELWLPSVCLLWPVLLDTGWTLVTRAWHGLPVWESHRMHIYQKLVDAGHSPARVSLAYAAASGCGVVIAWMTLRAEAMALLVGAAALVGFVAMTASGLRWRVASAAGGRKG